jgi:hypothetical protein
MTDENKLSQTIISYIETVTQTPIDDLICVRLMISSTISMIGSIHKQYRIRTKGFGRARFSKK